MVGDETEERLANWLTELLPDRDDVRIEGLGRVDVGH
jgi:hypothetical protein